MQRAAVFDLDGTLADTSSDLIAAANACLSQPILDPVADCATAFLGGRAMLRLGLSRLSSDPINPERIERMYPMLLDHYARDIDRHTRLYEGAQTALEDLQAAGWILAICTNKPEALAEDLVSKLGIRHHFAALLGADTLTVRKPDPGHLLETIRRAGGHPGHAALIGDTDTDRKAAAAADVPCVMVRFAPGGVPDGHAGPVLDHFDGLTPLLDELVPVPAGNGH